MKPFRKLAFLLGAASLATLGGCQQGAAPEPQQSAGEAIDDASGEAQGPDAKPGMTGSDGRMVLSAVPGRPAAVYFSVRNGGPAPVTLAGVDVARAGKAEMHKTEGGNMGSVDSVEVPAGGSVTFAPGGYHVMVFEPDATLSPGGTTELTLTFSGGDKLSMPLKIEAMGATGAMADMPGMHH